MRRASVSRYPCWVISLVLFTFVVGVVDPGETRAQGIPCDDYAGGGVVPFAWIEHPDHVELKFQSGTPRYRISYWNELWATPGTMELHTEIVDAADPYNQVRVYECRDSGDDDFPPYCDISHMAGSRFLVDRSDWVTTVVDFFDGGSTSHEFPGMRPIKGDGRYIWANHPMSGLRLYDAADLNAVVELELPIGMVMPSLIFDQLAIQHYGDLWTVVDLADPGGPSLHGSVFMTAAEIRGADFVEGLLFLSMQNGPFWRLKVLDLNDIDHPAIPGTIYPDRPIYSVVAQDSLLYCRTDAGIVIYDVGDPSAVRLVSGPFGNECTDFIVRGHFVYAREDAFVSVYDVSDIPVPIQLGSASARGTDLLAAEHWLVTGGNFLHFDCNDPLPIENDEEAPATSTMLPLSLTASQVLQGNAEIRFTLDHPGVVDLSVYDLRGRHLSTLVAASLPTGPHTAAWDGRETSGRVQPAGVYLARLQLDDRAATCKLTLMK
jgi:hypothetical protein